ncbi:hypothetical protein FAIPA1_30324 [Frankia sp. AiPs1]
MAAIAAAGKMSPNHPAKQRRTDNPHVAIVANDRTTRATRTHSRTHLADTVTLYSHRVAVRWRAGVWTSGRVAPGGTS